MAGANRTPEPWIGALAVAIGWQIATLGLGLLAPSPMVVWGCSEVGFGLALAVIGVLAARHALRSPSPDPSARPKRETEPAP